MHGWHSAASVLHTHILFFLAAHPIERLALQVLDFVALKERLERSHTRAVARSESAVYRVQVAASGAVTKGDFAGARLAALEALSDLQQPPDASQVRVTAIAKPSTKPYTAACLRLSYHVTRHAAVSHPSYTLTMYKHQLESIWKNPCG